MLPSSHPLGSMPSDVYRMIRLQTGCRIPIWRPFVF